MPKCIRAKYRRRIGGSDRSSGKRQQTDNRRKRNARGADGRGTGTDSRKNGVKGYREGRRNGRKDETEGNAENKKKRCPQNSETSRVIEVDGGAARIVGCHPRQGGDQRIRSASRTSSSSWKMARAARKANSRPMSGRAMAGLKPCVWNAMSEKIRLLRK